MSPLNEITYFVMIPAISVLTLPLETYIMLVVLHIHVHNITLTFIKKMYEVDIYTCFTQGRLFSRPQKAYMSQSCL